MGEHEIDEVASKAQRHDRWSVLIIGLNAATQLATVVANTLEQYTVMTVQHTNQKIYDRKFKQIADKLNQWEES